MKRFFILSLTMILALSAWADNDKVASNQATVWEFSGQTKDATIESTTQMNGLYIKAKTSSGMKYSQVKRSGTFSDGSAWTTTTDNASGIALYLASNSNLTPTTSYFSDLTTDGSNRTFRSVAFETAIAGKIYAAVYVSNATSGSINLYKVASEENVVASINVAEDLSSNKTATLEYEATEKSIFVFGSKDANTTLCYMKFVPEAVTAPIISNSDGTITITAGESNLTGEGNVTIKTYYTTDGTDPTASSTEYTGSFNVTTSCTVKAISINTVTGTTSSITSEDVTIAAALTDISTATVSLSATQIPYTGEELTPTVTSVVLGGNTLNAETDYDVSIIGQTEIGENYSATVTGKGNYSGTASTTWSITRGVGSISFSPASGSVSIGTTDFSVAVTKVGDGAVTYSSGTESVATIDASTGLVTPVSAGTTTITATVANGTNYDYATPTATYELTVSPLYTVTLSHKYGPLTVSCVEVGQSSGQAAAGDVITVSTGEPNAGYTESNIKIYRTGDSGKTSVATLSEGAFTMPAEDITIEVGYSRKSLSVTSNVPGGNGSLTFTSSREDGKFQVDVTAVTVTVSPDAGYRLKENTLIATYNGSETLSLTNTGELTYTFTMPGYDVTVSAEFELNTQSATITAESAQSVAYNGTPQAAVATASAGGVVVTYYTNSEHTEGETTTAPTNAGTYYAIVSQSDANYTSDPVNVTFAINKATLTATADDKSKTVGEANPELTVTVTGFVNDETAETAAGYAAPIASTEATTGSEVGSYPITVDGGSATNYSFDYHSGTLTVNSAAPSTYTITPTVSGNGEIHVVSGGSTTALTTATEYEANSSVQLVAVPSSGYQLSQWSGDGLAENDIPASIWLNAKTMTSNINLTATFIQQPTEIETISESREWTFGSFTAKTKLSGTVPYHYNGLYICGHQQNHQNLAGVESAAANSVTFEEGSTVNYSNYLWIAGGQDLSETNANKSPNEFVKDYVAFKAGVPGTVYVYMGGKKDKYCRIYSGGFLKTTDVALTADNSPAQYSAYVAAGDVVRIGTNSGAAYIYAIAFVPASYTFKATAGSNGSITVMKGETNVTEAVAAENGATYSYGTTLVLTPMPTNAETHEFDKWTTDGTTELTTGEDISINATTHVLTVNLKSNLTVQATFKEKTAQTTYTVTGVNDDGNGNKVEASPTSAAAGATVTLTITTATNYTLTSISAKDSNEDNVELSGSGNTRTFTMPVSNVTITATFAESAKTNISGATVTLSESTFIWNGSEHAPTVTAVKLGETNLTEGTDYTVNTIDNQTNVGTYTVMVTGTGNYTGEATANWTIKRNLGESVTLNGTQQWATYYAAEDLAKPEGVTIYRVTGVSETAVQTEEVNYIKANTGVLLYSGSAVSEDNLKVGPGSGEDYTSTLLGTVEASTMGAGTNYVLYNNQFMPAEDNTLLANHCYLQISVASGTRSLTIEHGDGNTTDIHTTRKDHGVMISDKYYTLSGQRIDKPTKKGLYIVNGRKVVIK